MHPEDIVEFKPPLSTKNDRVVPIWFATDREPEGDVYGNRPSNCTLYGRALVYVPEAHRFGETGSSFLKRLSRFDLRNDQLRLQSCESRDHESFIDELRTIMNEVRDGGEAPSALVYLHGFNTSFKEAAIRAAQFDVDLRVSGATAFFSWPSLGRIGLTDYTADEATIEASEAAISSFLVDFTNNCGADKVHLIAHSMGNRALLRSLQRIAADAESKSDVKFGQIFLAAPDVDRRFFLSLASLYSQYCDRATLYASAADKALAISTLLHKAPRAGYFTPYTVTAGLDTVVVPEFNVDLIGHSYYAEAEALLYDIYNLMQHNTEPQKRQRIVKMEHEGEQFWGFNR
ncbi:alpha/beta hydrolase [Synechococcus sp. L2F]|uniref:alpha/beta hydrolase n=1 Tax=Synechococcus sp. L2F TaxID=2823739 RepID=UPI0028F3ED20|nr:alpha/beta hydrolase [Synechococcus sp. L2F]